MARKKKLPSGMCLRGKVYYARFRANGRQICKRLSSDYRTACELLNDLRAKADRADFGLVDNDYSWSELKAEFLKWAKQTKRRPEEYEADLKKFEEFVSIRSVRQITHELVFGFREWRLEKVCARTVNKQVGTLLNLLNRAVAWGRIGANPISDIQPLRHDTPKKQRRSLTHEEVNRIFAASPEHLKPVWRMFACTGLRLRELTELRFSDVDFDTGILTVRANIAKGGKEREIPLDPPMLATVASLRDSADDRVPIEGTTPKATERQAKALTKDHVFTTTANTPWGGSLLRRFYSVCRVADIEGAEPGGSIDIHSMRVSFATMCLEGGASPKAVQTLLGHATLGMTMNVYAKATDRAKRDAIGALPFTEAPDPKHVISVPFDDKVSTSNSNAMQAVG